MSYVSCKAYVRETGNPTTETQPVFRLNRPGHRIGEGTHHPYNSHLRPAKNVESSRPSDFIRKPNELLLGPGNLVLFFFYMAKNGLKKYVVFFIWLKMAKNVVFLYGVVYG